MRQRIIIKDEGEKRLPVHFLPSNFFRGIGGARPGHHADSRLCDREQRDKKTPLLRLALERPTPASVAMIRIGTRTALAKNRQVNYLIAYEASISRDARTLVV
jgi:hypothetical protein